MLPLCNVCQGRFHRVFLWRITGHTWNENMAKKPRVLIDLNIILDVLQKREPFYAMSARVLACAETGLVEGMVAAHTMTTLFYLFAKNQSAEKARVALIWAATGAPAGRIAGVDIALGRGGHESGLLPVE